MIYLITTLAGLEADAPSRRLVVRPALPTWLDEVRFEGLRVGDAVVDLRVRREQSGGHQIAVDGQEGDLEVALEEG